jgi:small-conductance mechanosensitive channel
MTGIVEALQISSSPYINALISILIFALIAKIADIFVDKVLRKFTRFTHSELDDRIIDLIHRPILFTILILGVISAVIYISPPQKILFYVNGILYSIVAIIWCVTLIQISNSSIEHALRKVSDITGMRKDIIPLIESVSKIVIIVAVLLVLFSLWNVSITPLMASAGIVGAAVAFASKDAIANLFGGISVFMDKPFKIGDYIILDQGERGEVVAIGLRSTRIKTRDDILITIPNSIIANTKIINESAPVPNFRVRIPVSVAYGSDIDLVDKTLMEIADANDNVLNEPVPRVRFRLFGDSSLNFELLCWIKEPALRGLTIHELNSSIYKEFHERGIKIPFPQRDVHIHNS